MRNSLATSLGPLAVVALLLLSGAAAARDRSDYTKLVLRSVLAPAAGLGLGMLSGATGAIVGSLVGGCYSLQSNPDPVSGGLTCMGAVLGGLMGGFLLGTPAGVTWIGDLLGGRGSFGGALAGVVVGMVVTAFIAFSLTPTLLPPRPEALGPILLATAVLPPAGAVIGYELISAMRAMVEPPEVALAPLVRQGQVDGAVLALRLASF